MLDCGNFDRIGNGAAGNSRWQIVQGGLFGYIGDLKAVILEFCDRKVEHLRACCQGRSQNFELGGGFTVGCVQ